MSSVKAVFEREFILPLQIAVADPSSYNHHFQVKSKLAVAKKKSAYHLHPYRNCLRCIIFKIYINDTKKTQSKNL